MISLKMKLERRQSAGEGIQVDNAANITIPAAALEAGARAIAESLRTARLTTEAQDGYKPEARAACLAMLDAWPGMRERPFWDFMTGARHIEIILPIPKGLDFIDPLTAQENPDDKA
jgi:hypothetical protein